MPFPGYWFDPTVYAAPKWYPFTVNKDDARKGRRYRAFCHSLAKVKPDDVYENTEEAYRVMSEKRDERFAALPFTYVSAKDPELHRGLQDLGWMIGWDIHEACDAFDNPDIWYPGVDEGIDPVPDSLIEVVIPALQRELDRELRYPENQRGFAGSVLPAVPLAELPWRIQRAITERRRYRYKQFGLSNANRESGVWSLWDVPSDDDWIPSWISS